MAASKDSSNKLVSAIEALLIGRDLLQAGRSQVAHLRVAALAIASAALHFQDLDQALSSSSLTRVVAAWTVCDARLSLETVLRDPTGIAKVNCSRFFKKC